MDAPGSPFPATAAFGVLANCALVARTIERHLHQQDISNLLSGPLWSGLLSGLSGITFALAAMAILGNGSLLAVTGLGIAVTVFVAIVRRLGFRSLASAILFTMFVAAVGAVSMARIPPGKSDLLRFVSSAAPDAVALAERMLSGASWLGNGVGTFELTSRAYQDFGATMQAGSPSTAILIAIEWGRPALVILAGLAAQLFFFAFRGAVRRGRDFFFASAAAASVLVVFCEAFFDASLLSTPVQIISSVMVGLGIAQSAGRTSGFK